MSFSKEVREELARQQTKSHHCRLAELAGILMMAGSVSGNPLVLCLDHENESLREKYRDLMQECFGLDVSRPIEKEDTLRVLKELGWYESRPERRLPLQERTVSENLLELPCCRRAFMRGAFLAAGSMSDPEKSYHFEIVCRKKEQAIQLVDAASTFGAAARIVERKGHAVFYVKEADRIGDLLRVMEAYVSLMRFDNIRSLKKVRNKVNRKVNCETANIGKTVSAFMKQQQEIEKIRERLGFENLPDKLREMAKLRLEYPDASLKELGELSDPPIGRSGVNHRLRKLGEIAAEL